MDISIKDICEHLGGKMTGSTCVVNDTEIYQTDEPMISITKDDTTYVIDVRTFENRRGEVGVKNTMFEGAKKTIIVDEDGNLKVF